MPELIALMIEQMCLGSDIHSQQIVIDYFHLQVKKLANEEFEKFPGISGHQAVTMICKASGDNGEAIIEEFTEAFSDAGPEIMHVLRTCLAKVRA